MSFVRQKTHPGRSIKSFKERLFLIPARLGPGYRNVPAFAANPPPMVKGKRLKLFYATQSGGDESRPLAPPEFVLFVNSPRLLAQPYARFLEATIREIEPYPGLPVLLKARARSES